MSGQTPAAPPTSTGGPDCGLLASVKRLVLPANLVTLSVAGLVAGLFAGLVASPAAAFDDAFKAIDGGAWDISGGPIPYSLEPAGSADIDPDVAKEALRASFRAWACVEGTSVRFEETDEPGVATVDGGDGINTLFWDEDGSLCGMGPGTLGITVGDAGNGTRSQADICFNGNDSDWGVGAATDVQSIAMHEIGHFIGLDHPCDGASPNETNCLPDTDAIMFPAWSGRNEREPLKSDIAGVVALYPADPDLPTGCNGPFGPGEKCDCNDSCVDGLVCVPDPAGQLRCGKACASDDADCGTGLVCVLDVPQDGNAAPGTCVAVVRDKPAGAICSQGPECASGTCVADVKLGRSICLVVCDNDDDCAGGTCFDGKCLGGFESQECEAPDEEVPPSCFGCSVSGSTVADVSVVAGLLLLLRRRRRGARGGR